MPKFGVTAGLTTTVRVAVVAHSPLAGVKVRRLLPDEAAAGLNMLPLTPFPDQFPFTPLTVPGSTSAGSLAQKGPIGLGLGTVGSVMDTIMVVGKAHCPAVGVKFAVMELPPCPAGLIVEGLQVPVMLLLDVVGNTTELPFSQSGPTGANVGVGATVPETTTLSKV